MISSEAGYQAIVDRSSARFLGFVCTGAEARVRGMDAVPGVLDVGVGLDPAIIGQGRGTAIMQPILNCIARTADPREFRAVVQSWNERSLRLCRRLGFRPQGLHVAVQTGKPVEYVVLRREAQSRVVQGRAWAALTSTNNLY